MSRKTVITDILVDGEMYHVHANIVGCFWNGYIVYNNEYFLSLPSSSNVDTLLRMAETAIRDRRKST